MSEKQEMSRVERKKVPARERILEAAEQLFLVEGSYEKATIREIANRADVSVGAVYLHFDTKVDILAALTAMNTSRIRNELFQQIPQKGTGREKLEVLLDFLDSLRTDRFFTMRDRLPFFHVDPKINAVIRETLAREISAFITVFEDILREGGIDGSIRSDLDPHTTAVTLVILANSFVHELIVDANINLPIHQLLSIEMGQIFKSFSDLIRSALLSRTA